MWTLPHDTAMLAKKAVVGASLCKPWRDIWLLGSLLVIHVFATNKLSRANALCGLLINLPIDLYPYMSNVGVTPGLRNIRPRNKEVTSMIIRAVR
jgi:hypothetical protein